MSFIRQEVRDVFAAGSGWVLARLEPLSMAAMLALGLALTLRGLGTGAWVTAAIGSAISAIFGAGLVVWRRRARFQAATGDVGVVEITEHRIGYFAPDAGGFVDMDGLTELEIVTTDQGPLLPDVFWVLSHDGGPPLMIPIGAEGAGRLVDAFASLPGVDMETATAALASTSNERFLIWKRVDT